MPLVAVTVAAAVIKYKCHKICNRQKCYMLCLHNKHAFKSLIRNLSLTHSLSLSTFISLALCIPHIHSRSFIREETWIHVKCSDHIYHTVEVVTVYLHTCTAHTHITSVSIVLDLYSTHFAFIFREQQQQQKKHKVYPTFRNMFQCSTFPRSAHILDDIYKMGVKIRVRCYCVCACACVYLCMCGCWIYTYVYRLFKQTFDF